MQLSSARVRALTVVLGGVGLVGIGLVPACSTGAVGIDACRQLESARCEIAPVCEGSDPSFGIVTEEQVRNCQVFYHDHCLVGLENADSEEDPLQDDVDDCEAAIRALGACQTAGTATIGACEGTGVAEDDPAAALTPCEALKNPERMPVCAFVAKPDDEDE